MPVLNTQEQERYDHALHYPGVEPDDFNFEYGSYLLSRNSDGQWHKSGVEVQSTEVTQNGGGVRLKNANQEVPLHNIILKSSDGQVLDLQQRVPIIGIGSNSSHRVLSRKFSDSSGQQDIPVIQIKIPEYVVAHSAFLMEEGGVAVSIHPHESGFTHATLGFYTEELANRLTGTEFNYDGVAIDARILTPVKGMEDLSPLAYVSAWGVITKDGQTPLGTTHIPGSLTNSVSTKEAIAFCRDLTNAGKPVDEFMADNIKDDAERLRRTAILQDGFSLAARTKGQNIFPAVKSGQPGFPSIHYT